MLCLCKRRARDAVTRKVQTKPPGQFAVFMFGVSNDSEENYLR